MGKQRDGLYYLATLTTRKIGTTSHSSPNNQPTCNLTTSSTDLWHSRLGHISHSRLSFIAKNFLKFSIQSNNACPICPLAKQHCLLLVLVKSHQKNHLILFIATFGVVINILHFLVHVISLLLLMITRASLGFF